MSILIGLIPALGWGFLPVSVAKMGGTPVNQILGTTAGTFLIALVTFLILRPAMTGTTMLLSAASGALWVVGQVGQYHAFVRMGVSRTMPVSTGLQVAGTSLIGVFVFGEWPSLNARLIGFAALAVVVLGIFLTSLSPQKADKASDKATLLLLFFTNFGFLAYSAIPDLVGTKGTGIFLPQATGMLGAASIYALFSGKTTVFREKASWRNLLSGLLFSIAALSYILSAQQNGIATGFVLAQVSVVIATLSGILILKEKKSPPELKRTLLGLLLIVIGGSVTALL